MSAFAVGHLRSITFGDPIIEYLQRIDATLAPFGGRFAVHGATPDVLEGTWVGDLVIIEFPDKDNALEWYHSPAYKEILPLRTDHSDSTILVVDGVTHPHLATDIIRR